MRERRWRRLSRIFARDPAEEVGDELDFHLEQRIRDYIASGLDPESARAAALERLGDVDRARDECVTLLSAERRARERRMRLNVSWLDVKLGLRMLAKYPGLSLVSVIGMAAAIAIGAAVFGAIGAALSSSLPLDEGDRIVAVRTNRADRPGTQERRVLHDFVAWRTDLTTVRDLGAFRPNLRNLIVEGRGTQLVALAEMSASGFRVARVAPLLGRTLMADDERAGAEPVLVIGYDEWQRHFDGDPDVVGRTVRLGETVHTVVGVMPEGFRFPVNHGFWVPLRVEVTDYEIGTGPSIEVFGRVADGATIEQARTQVAAIGRRMAAAYPDTHEHLRPTVVPYAHTAFDMDSPGIAWAMYVVRFATTLILVVIAVNVAVLVYARTATRMGEIAVRTALGASRIRIIAQLFVEAIVLSTAAAAIGLAIAGFGLDWFERLLDRRATVPFWIDFGLSAELIIYAGGLAILAGTIVGVLPALKVTGRRVHGSLQQLAARGSWMQLGRTWTALIVAQVAVAVAILPPTIHHAGELVRYGLGRPGYPAEEYVRANVFLEREESPAGSEADAYQRAYEARFAESADALMRRLAAEPGVDASFASDFHDNGPDRWFEVEGSGAAATADGATAETTIRATVSSIGPGFFALYDARILAGRDFVDGDAAEASTAVIVDRSFADRMGGAGVLGRRIRDVDALRDASSPADSARAPWLEIVGIVSDLPSPAGPDDDPLPNVYRPATPGSLHAGGGVQPLSIPILVHVRNGPTSAFTRRLRDIVASVDPRFQLHGLRNVAEADRMNRRTFRTFGLAVASGTLSVLLLSVAGIYSMLSFTVAQRRREIGIRTALGADPRRILTGIFARAGAQLGTGIAVGLILAVVFEWASGGKAMGGESRVEGAMEGMLVLMLIGIAIVLAVGLLASIGPARRGLSVQPTEALREE